MGHGGHQPGYSSTTTGTATKQEKATQQPFSSVEELQAFAQKKWKYITWDLEGCDLECATAVLNEWTILSEKYPQVAKMIEYIGTYQNQVPKDLRRMINAGSKLSNYEILSERKTNEMAHFYRFGEGRQKRGGSIGLNPRFFGDADFLKSRIRSDIITGWHPEGCDSVEAVFAHEFGHAVDHWMNDPRVGLFTDISDRSIYGAPANVGDTWGLIEDSYPQGEPVFSAYANMEKKYHNDSDEPFAEAFTANECGNKIAKNHPYVKAQAKFIEYLMKRVKEGSMVPTSERKWLHEIRRQDLRKSAKQKMTDFFDKELGIRVDFARVFAT